MNVIIPVTCTFRACEVYLSLLGMLWSEAQNGQSNMSDVLVSDICSSALTLQEYMRRGFGQHHDHQAKLLDCGICFV